MLDIDAAGIQLEALMDAWHAGDLSADEALDQLRQLASRVEIGELTGTAVLRSGYLTAQDDANPIRNQGLANALKSAPARSTC